MELQGTTYIITREAMPEGKENTNNNFILN